MNGLEIESEELLVQEKVMKAGKKETDKKRTDDENPNVSDAKKG